ncbi:MAG: amidohydrolase family protein [Oscillospiraceae bacterium]|nr:amidohydrolase family protein [Oscillospiraceae bacterium]
MSNLYECHCHIALDGEDFKTAAAKHKNGADMMHIRSVFEKYRSMSFAYIRDGGDKWGVSAAASKIAAEYGIEYASPVFPIHKKGNYGSFIGRSFESMADYRGLVKEVKNSGGDFIKVMASGIMDFGRFGVLTGWELSLDEMREMVTIAHGEGFAVMVHVNGADGVKRCVEAGADSIEHGNYMDEDAVRYIAESGCVWVPTVSATTELRGKNLFPEDMLGRILNMQEENIRLGAALGALVASGSDAGAKCVYHGEGSIKEIEYLSAFISEDQLLKAQEKIRQVFKRQG